MNEDISTHTLGSQRLTSGMGCAEGLGPQALLSPSASGHGPHTHHLGLPELTSSFVVWLELIRYVWKPERPTIDQTEKKHTTASSTVAWSQGAERGRWGELSGCLRSQDDVRFGWETPTDTASGLRVCLASHQGRP